MSDPDPDVDVPNALHGSQPQERDANEADEPPPGDDWSPGGGNGAAGDDWPAEDGNGAAEGDETGIGAASRLPRWLRPATIGPLLLVGLMIAAGLFAAYTVTPTPNEEALARPQDADVVLSGGTPLSWDPVAISDATSAQMLAQVFEGLTVLDEQSQLRPALAESWTMSDDGRQLTFRLRPGLQFSDGSPISADDVRRSWLRLLDPARPSTLASLLDDVSGAAAYARGQGSADDVGISADGDVVRVDFERPAAYFPAVTAVPSLAIVPPSIDTLAAGPVKGRPFPASGAYVPVEQTLGQLRLLANDRYWGGPPALPNVTVITDAGGRSGVNVFEDGAVDWTPIAASDATWIRYDRELGPQLRMTEEMAVDFLGFDTTRPPFDDVRVRRAVAMAVDWRRLDRLARPAGIPATSILPPGIPGRSNADYLLPYDPDAARAALAAAGYPGGSGFPPLAITTYGIGPSEAIAAELQHELGIDVSVEQRPFEQHSILLDTDTPPLWTLSWSADYPHAHDFLGLLLRSGSSANAGGWSDPAYDALVDAAAGTTDPTEQQQLYDEAQAIVRDEVPLIPLGYSDAWSLGRDGLRGATLSSAGILRYADLAWEG